MVKVMGDSQVARLLDLVPYLTLNQGVSLEKIADDFNTSKSEILADLNTLWMCGLPGYTPLELIDLSFETGFVSIRNAEILSIPRKLTDAEVGAIIIGLSIIRESISKHSEHVLLIEELLSRLSMKSQVTAPEVVSTGIPTDLRYKIHSAMKSNHSVKISYLSFSRDEITSRKISPLSFSQEVNHEYVHSFCHTSQNFKVFRMDRILEVHKSEALVSTSSTEEKIVETGFNLLIKVRSNARKIAETFQIQIPIDQKAGEQFHGKAHNPEWIVRTICSLQNSAEIVEPLEMRSMVANRAQKALNLYS
jgi:proteasome accessory factor C